MKTLDRYIIRTFVSTAVLLLVVMMMLRIVLDLFMHMDEFTEQSASFLAVIGDIWEYYATQSLVYFIEIGGLIIVLSAAVSLVRMNHTNELTAMLASGVSLHRVVLPIIICSMLLGGVIILDQELLVPRVAHLLIRDHDETGKGARKEFFVPLMADSSQTVWYSPRYSSSDKTMHTPTATLRDDDTVAIGRICTARDGAATYGKFGKAKGWHITRANLVKLNRTGGTVWPASPTTERIWTHLNPTSLLGRLKLAATGNAPPQELRRVFDTPCGLELNATRFQVDPHVPGRPRTGHLVSPRFVFRDDKGRLLAIVYARGAKWVFSQDVPSVSGYWQLDRCCRADAVKCDDCGLEKGSPGCCKITKGADAVLCAKCGQIKAAMFLPSDMTPDALVLRQAAGWTSYMSTMELTRLLQLKHIPGERTAVLTLHTRVANPINNLVMLLLGLPFILSRQRNLRTSVGLNILVVGAFYIFVYACRYLDVAPVWSAWLPVLVFGPLAVVMFDTVKT